MHGYYSQELFDNPIYSYGKAWLNKNGNINYEYNPSARANKYINVDGSIVVVNFISPTKIEKPGYEYVGELKEFVETIVYYRD